MKFKAVQKRNPQSPDEPFKWYAQVATSGETTMDDIVKEIEKFSALSEPDIRGVIIGLENVVQNKLAEGRIIRFDRLGSLYPSLSSSSSETEKEVTSANIRTVKVNYRPGKRIMDAMKNTPKEKVK
jgi:predicted histone-like DNA-binding protein